MRILIDSLIGLMLIAVAVGVVMLNHDRSQDERNIVAVQGALDRLHEQAAYHTTVQSAMEGRDTLLVHMHEAWFGDDLPTNVMLKGDRPWLDLAPPGDLGLHPPDPIVTSRSQAGFWYNPTTKVFRARVSPAASEAQTLAIYNQVNGTALDAFEQIPDPSRRPIAHELGKTPATQYASMANRTWSEPRPEPAEVNEKLFAPLLEAAATTDQPAAVEQAEQAAEQVDWVDEEFARPAIADEPANAPAESTAPAGGATEEAAQPIRPTLGK